MCLKNLTNASGTTQTSHLRHFSSTLSIFWPNSYKSCPFPFTYLPAKLILCSDAPSNSHPESILHVRRSEKERERESNLPTKGGQHTHRALIRKSWGSQISSRDSLASIYLHPFLNLQSGCHPFLLHSTTADWVAALDKSHKLGGAPVSRESGVNFGCQEVLQTWFIF